MNEDQKPIVRFLKPTWPKLVMTAAFYFSSIIIIFLSFFGLAGVLSIPLFYILRWPEQFILPLFIRMLSPDGRIDPTLSLIITWGERLLLIFYYYLLASLIIYLWEFYKSRRPSLQAKKIVPISIFVIVGVIVASAIISNKLYPCDTVEKHFEVPNFLRGGDVTVSLGREMVMVDGYTRRWGLCNEIELKINRFLEYDDPSFESEPWKESESDSWDVNFIGGKPELEVISKDAQFKVIGIYWEDPIRWRYTGGGGKKTVLILEDEQGREVLLGYYEVNDIPGDYNYDTKFLLYYKNGELVGHVRMPEGEDIFHSHPDTWELVLEPLNLTLGR